MNKKLWLLYALITTITWGIWGAFIETPEKAGFPATLGYIVWALTMIPCAIVALMVIKWKLQTDFRSILLGSAIGFLGAGGQLILFQALRDGPAYIVFPFISLFPVLTIFLSVVFLKEKTGKRQWVGIVIALIAILFLSYQKPGESVAQGYLWLILSIFVFIFWGIQAYVMKFSNETMSAESIFFYMMATAVILIPVAFFMTDFSQNINWSFNGPYLAAIIQVLNSVGALMLVYALRYGKAIVVIPLVGLSPLITVVLSLILYSMIPGAILSVGLVLAVLAIILLSK
ncbi:MAG: DMT family transporter [Lentimicrobiaceae bacterium]|jgi:drug/metabolite transporter (DMT)-like permease